MAEKKTPEAAAQEAAKTVADAPSDLAIKALAEKVADVVAAKTLSREDVREMFVEYHKQQAENAQKALEGKPEEASQPDVANIYQAKTAAQWFADMGLVTPVREEKSVNAFGALCKGIAYGLIAGNNEKGLERAIKDKALGQHEGYVAKALGVDVFTAGGALQETMVADEVVPALLSETAVFGDPAIPRVMVNGDMEFPCEVTAPTARWVAENAAANASEPAFDVVVLRPEAIRIIVPVSRKALRSVSSMAANVQRSISNKFSDAVDAKLLRGDGTVNTPVGLRYLVASANIQTANASPTVATLDTDLLKLIQVIQDANVPGSPATKRWAFPPRFWRYLMAARGTDTYLYRAELAAGRLLGIQVAGASAMGISNLPTNLSYTGSSENEVILYETSGLRLGIGEDLAMKQTDSGAYANSSGTLVSAFSSDQMVFGMFGSVGLVDVYRGLGIAVMPDCDYGA